MTTEERQCMWCDAPATHWCDAVIGFQATGVDRRRDGSVRHLLTGLNAECWTCDAPMCDKHGTRVGFISGTDPDTIDHCQHHASVEHQDMSKLIIFASEIDGVRRDLYAAIRRQRIRAAASLADPASTRR